MKKELNVFGWKTGLKKINKNTNVQVDTCTVITSLYSKKNMTQAGVIYLSTALSNAKVLPDIIDLSGSLDYFDSPEELYSEYNSKNWLNPNSITHGVWMDKYGYIRNSQLVNNL